MDLLRSLEVFACIAEQGSLTRCADSLSITRSAATRALGDLENRLKVRLLQRSTRKVSLTAEGQEVLEHARELFLACRSLEAISIRRGEEVAGEIRVMAPCFFGTRALGPALTAFASKYPSTRIDLQLSDGPVDLIGSGIDIAICITRKLPQSVIARRIGEVALGVYASPSYRQRKGLVSHPSQLKTHDCLTCTNLSANGIEWAFKSTDPHTPEALRHRPVGRLNSNSHEALLSATLQGLGVAVLPEYVAEKSVASGELLQMLEGWACAPLGIYLVYLSRAHQPARLRRLIEHLTDALGTPRASSDATVRDTSPDPTGDVGAHSLAMKDGSDGAWRRAYTSVLDLRSVSAVGQRFDGASMQGS